MLKVGLMLIPQALAYAEVRIFFAKFQWRPKFEFIIFLS